MAESGSYPQAVSQGPLDPSEIGPGTRLGRYEIVLPVGLGGMARVWAALQTGQRGFQKLVAVKTILPAFARDPEFEAMFLEESRLATHVHHPNVAEIFDLGEEDEVLYLAMEFVNGESLHHLLRAGGKSVQPLDARIAARIAADACAGLHAAHELVDDLGQRLNIVHRDVSPQNILVGENGTVKLCDFGVAKALDKASEATSSGQLKGKIAYMAPEQARAGAVDRRSDLYALGICLYEMTTGQRPFRGDSQVVVLEAVVEGKFPRPSAVVPGYPPELEAIILRAMTTEPAKRFASGDRMRGALEEYLARSGPPVTSTEVARVVRERLGERIEARRAQIREVLAARTDDDPSVSKARPARVRPEREDTPLPAFPLFDSPDEPKTPTASLRPLAPPPPPMPAPLPAAASSNAVSGVVSTSGGSAEASALSIVTGSAPGNLGASAVPSPGVATPPSASAPTPAPAPVAAAASAGAAAAPKGGMHALVGALLGTTLVLGIVAGITVWKLTRPVVVAGSVATASTAAPVGSPVVVHAKPATASLLVDGAIVGVGDARIARPTDGTTRQVVVRADGYANETVAIDEHSPESLEISLRPVAKVDASATAKAVAPKSPPPAAPAPPKPPKIELPKNPF